MQYECHFLLRNAKMIFRTASTSDRTRLDGTIVSPPNDFKDTYSDRIKSIGQRKYASSICCCISVARRWLYRMSKYRKAGAARHAPARNSAAAGRHLSRFKGEPSRLGSGGFPCPLPLQLVPTIKKARRAPGSCCVRVFRWLPIWQITVPCPAPAWRGGKLCVTQYSYERCRFARPA